ncbi:P-loop containing nucleoside triphosphate hydrolase [Pleurotus pulmonarius]|nr:hypothetical protein EYR38_007084 [Pleurotus pulmonarius]
MAMRSATQVISDHVIANLALHRSSRLLPPPLFVAIQGPQGSGKTYLTSQLKQTLASDPHSLNVAVLSIDDLYLPHDGLKTLAEQYRSNKLWQGRGQPGTHDIALGVRLMQALHEINAGGQVEVELPVFDKSLYNGEGDRSAHGGDIIRAPLDVVLLEGWCTGFYPIPAIELENVWSTRWPQEMARLGLDAGPDPVCRKEDVIMVNEALKQYIDLWKYFTVFVQITPIVIPGKSPYEIIYEWRRQQEHHMKAQNGGRGMSDEGVKHFVDRYIPGYVFFGEGVSKPFEEQGDVKHPPWLGNGLRLVIGEERELVAVEEF